MEENSPTKKLFPYNSVVGIVNDVDDVHALIEDLTAAGFEEGDLAVLSGAQGMEVIDAKGQRHGLLGRIFRALDTMGSEHDETQLHMSALRDGHIVVAVSLKDDADKGRVAELFRKHRGHEIHYYSRWTTEDLTVR
jgi:hypothetical protein